MARNRIASMGDYSIRLFATSGDLIEACHAFNKVPIPNEYSWNAIILALAKLGQGYMALKVYDKLLEAGIRSNKYLYVSVLKACSTISALNHGRHIHDPVIKTALQSDIVIGSALVDMYAKCRSLDEACKVFDNVSNPDVVLWNAMIAGYVQHDASLPALECFCKMQQEGTKPNIVTFSSILKACGKIGYVDHARYAHEQMIETCDQFNPIVENTLIDMYAKCGNLEEARKVFDKLQVRDVVSWGAMIAGYTQHYKSSLALECFDSMQNEKISADTVILSSILKACGSNCAIEQGRCIHEKIFVCVFESDVLGNALVDMYVKCGKTSEACNVFDNLQNKNVVSWNAMVAGYNQDGESLLALECFADMQHERLKPSKVTFSCVFKACGNIGNVAKGRHLHEIVLNTGLHLDVVVGSAIVDMYAKCGHLEEAGRFFHYMPNHDVVSWGTMIAAYAQFGKGHFALQCYEAMQQSGIEPDRVIYLSILKACGSVLELEQGRRIDNQIIQTGLQADVVVGSSLVDMYAKCGCLDDARRVFDSFPSKDLVLWGTMIAGYTQHSKCSLALECFSNMQNEHTKPDEFIFSSILKACSNLELIYQGRGIHKQVMESGFEYNVYVVNALLDMYAKCGSFEEAYEVFDKLPSRDTVSWAAMIGACVQNGKGLLALQCYDKMLQEGIMPNEVTFSSILKACINIQSVEQGRYIHQQVFNSGLHADVVVASALIDMYAKCGNLEEGRKIFDASAERDVVSWGAIIYGYTQHNECIPALECFDAMQHEGIASNEVVYLSILKVCGSIGATQKGLHIHQQIIERGFQSDTVLNNTLISMYAKCGIMEEATKVFDNMSSPDVVSWGALIAGYAQLGDARSAASCFEDMVFCNIEPNDVIFTGVFSACSRSGFVDEGRRYFRYMVECYGITPNTPHYNCMIDVLGRGAFFKEAEGLLRTVMATDICAWTTLLSACSMHENLELGRQLFTEIVSLDTDCAVGYVLMSNIYSYPHHQEISHTIENLVNLEDFGDCGMPFIQALDMVRRPLYLDTPINISEFADYREVCVI